MHVIIVGAGIIGATTAVELAAAGHHVTLIDPSPGSGASHHAGGMLAPAAEVVYQQHALFPLMRASASWYPELIATISAHTELPTGYRTDGTVVLAADRADLQHLQELRAYQLQHGMEVEELSLRQARRFEPALSPRLAGAVHIPGDHQVSPRLLVRAALDAAANLGVKLHRSKAVSIDPDSARVQTLDGTVEGDHVVLASGLAASEIGGWSSFREPLQLRPVYGDIVRLQVPPHQRPLLGKVVRAFVEDRPVYLIPRSDHTIAIGATSREDDLSRPRVDGVYELLRDAIRVLPAVEECEFLEATTGARPGTPDDLPYLGTVADTLTISTGYFRHGILLAALAARSTRELLADAPAVSTAPDPARRTSIDLSACAPLRHAR